MDDNLDTLEREIGVTRARLKANIEAISSQSTWNGLKTTMKAEAVDAKDEAVAYAQTAGTDMLRAGFDTLKQKAASNPAAALMIGAGIGWKLWKNPPVAAALVGVGLFSLFSSRENDPLRSATKFVRDSAEDAAAATVETVTRTAHDLREKAGSLVDTAKDKAGTFVDSAKDKAGALVDSAKDKAGTLVDSAKDQADAIFGSEIPSSDIRAIPLRAPNVDAAQRQVLLSVAGVAVAAAIATSVQRLRSRNS